MSHGFIKAESRQRKGELDRIAAMLGRLGGRGYRVKKGSGNTNILNSIPIPIAISIRYNPNFISLDPNFGALSSP